MSRLTGRGFEDKLKRLLEENGVDVLSFSTTSVCDLLILPNILCEVKSTKYGFYNCTLTKGSKNQYDTILRYTKDYGFIGVYGVRFISGINSHWEFFNVNDGHIFRAGKGRLMNITSKEKLLQSMIG